MDKLTIPRTVLTPEIDFDYAAHRLVIKGESYPENVGTFYAPVFASLHEYLADATQRAAEIRVEVAMTYINSASTKSFQQLLGMLDAAARAGVRVSVSWIVDPDDDALTELGEELLRDKIWLTHAIVHSTAA